MCNSDTILGFLAIKAKIDRFVENTKPLEPQWELLREYFLACGCVVIAVEKTDAEEQLAEALPALERARKALERLNKEDVTEIRQFANPPQAVQYVCACVAYLKGYKQADWKTCRGMMSDTNFLQSLQNLDVDNIRDKEVHMRYPIHTLV